MLDKILQIDNQEIEVSIHFQDFIDGDEINEKGMKYVQTLYGELGNAIDLIADKFLDIYNESWSDPEEGFPIMEKEEFKRCFEFRSVVVLDTEKSGALFFTDNGVFRGHHFEVDFDENDNPSDVSMMG